mmetsp:Transcript_24535/g.40906  ORF Transcript_24535/g.40906 Transcript_24535/m.40906 type:complete len:746 (+) Transcript_24535:103-2340(+)
MEKNNINDWLASQSQSPVQIWCEDPETSHEKIGNAVVSIGKSYLTYRILCKQVGRDIVGVRHRYSEFEALRKDLYQRYGPLGVAIPCLPPKNVVASIVAPHMKTALIKERTLGLTLFCELIVASPWLRNDDVWKDFLKPKAYVEEQQQQQKQAVGSISSVDRGGGRVLSVGEEKLLECLTQLVIPYKQTMTQRMEDIRQEITLIEKFVKPTLDKVRGVQAAERAYYAAQASLAASLQQWETMERVSVKSFEGRIFDEGENVLVHVHEQPIHSVQNVGVLVAKKAALLQHVSDHTGLTLAVLLEQELAMVDSMRDLLKLHDDMVSSIESVANKISKAEASRSVSKYELVAEQRAILDERKSLLATFYKGFIFFTLPCLVRQRAASLRKFTASMAAAHFTATNSLYGACLQFFVDLSLKPSSAMAAMNRELELLRMPLLPALPEDDEDCVSDGAGASLAGAGAGAAAGSPPYFPLTTAAIDATASVTLSTPIGGDVSAISGSNDPSAVAGCDVYNHLRDVSLSSESSGVADLMHRAVRIGAESSSSSGGAEYQRRIIGGGPSNSVGVAAATTTTTTTTSANSIGDGTSTGAQPPSPSSNPLLFKRRGPPASVTTPPATPPPSAAAADGAGVVSDGNNHHNTASSSSSSGGGGVGGGGSLMAEVPDEMLDSLDIRPSEDVVAKLGARSGINNVSNGGATGTSSSMVPLKQSQKTKSLLADLMGGGDGASSSSSSSPQRGEKSSVWEDV